MSLNGVDNGEAFQRHRETVEWIMADRVDDRDDEESSESEVETEFVEFEDEDSESESVGQVEAEETMKSYFARINARRANKLESCVSSCASVGEDGAVRHECAANVGRTLELAVRVLHGRRYKGQEKPIMGRDIIEIKRNEMSDMQLASRHVDTAKASARALLHVAFLQSKMPYVCARHIAQFFQPQLNLRDVRRSFYRHEGPVRNTCIDICSLRLVYPSWFDFEARNRKRQRVLDSKRHALWCYVAWASMFAAWAPLDEVGVD